MKKVSDKDGNFLFFADDGVYLVLHGDVRRRKVLSFRQGRIIKNVTKRNIMRVNKSVGFNYSALKMLDEFYPQFRFVHIKYAGLIKRASIKDILTRGSFLHFKKEGFERQLFFPIMEFENCK